MLAFGIKLYIAISIYVILCLTVARIGRFTLLGYWGILLLSILVTPLLTGIAVVLLKPKQTEIE